MDPADKHILDMYLVNQGLRLDMELSAAKLEYSMHEDCKRCMLLLAALERKEQFDKFEHDLCALLNI